MIEYSDRSLIPRLLLAMFLCALFDQNTMAQSNSARSLAATCATCHGIDGQAKEGMKSLAGRKTEEIANLVIEFRSGQRPATIMHQIARGYTNDQLRLIAEYFASQPAPPNGAKN